MFVFRNWLKRVTALLVALTAIATLPAGARAEATEETPIKIGMVASLFRDVPASLMLAMMGPFKSLMKSQTGVPGDLIPGGEAFDVAQQLAENKIDLAVFHGIEFAWIKQKYPQIQPLMIAVNQERHFRVHLVVRGGDSVKSIADLTGLKIALPKGTREHSRLFLAKHCQICGKNTESFFKATTMPATVEEALDDVVDGEVQAAIVESVPLSSYTRRKPGRASQLKSLIISEVFPSGVIAYNPGHLDEETLDKFRNGMTNASKNMMGRQMLMLWKLTSFEPVPEDYETICKTIAQIYPSPVAVPEPIAAPKTETQPAPTEAEPEKAEAEDEPKATEPEPETTPDEPEGK
jgi:ABC-type phosphate/phosphonate transport system substrate-binding protein